MTAPPAYQYRMRQKHGTASQWSTKNPVLSDGEIGYDETNNRFKVGDGATPWNTRPLPFANDYLGKTAAAVDSNKLGGRVPSDYVTTDSGLYLPASSASAAATANSIAKRTATGTLVVAPAVATNEAATLDQQTTAIATATSSNRKKFITRLLTASATLAATDENGIVNFNATVAVTCTIPTNATVPIAVGFIVDIQTISATGPVTISPAAGVTLRTPGGTILKCITPYSPVRLLKIGVDEWMVIGGVTDTGLIAVTLTNPVTAGSGDPPWYRKVNNRVSVHINSGYNGSYSNGFNFFSLPVGCRPPTIEYFICTSYAGNQFNMGVHNVTGNVFFASGTVTYTGLLIDLSFEAVPT